MGRSSVRLQLHALAYNLANFMRTLALPRAMAHWSLTTLREKLVKIARGWSAWPLRHLPDGRGCSVGTDVRADTGAHRPTACAAGAGLTRTAADMDGKAMGEVCFGDGKTEVER